jgi:hypothetical protein
MELMFDDLMADLAEAGWFADKSFDEIPVTVEIPDEVWEVARGVESLTHELPPSSPP